ncbi:transporter substrate-binding domain-containing protein [Afifella sp. IM 167]|uniref:transporter substrate-binding domain-containing protein n=1 Tax=Afifella sp. IM 167 TaxID=2033586 RepID=UPI001CC922BA|nr:transporter substrate-binding domain-containing protein [Afifella sp. IM 167]
MQKPRILFLLSLLALVAAGIARAQEPVIPNFWDPRSRIERPNTDTIGPIRFLATNDFPPFSYRDRRGALIGFDIDLVRAVCEVLEAECAIQTRPFDTLEKALRDKEGDAVIAGLSPDPEAKQPLLATRPYLKVPARFVSLSDAAFDPDKAEGDFVGVVCHSAHQAYLERYFPDLAVACYPNLGDALASLKEKRLKAVFGDALRLSFWIHGETSGACCAFSSGPYLNDNYFGDGLKIVVRPNESELKSALDYALREVYRKGTYAELYLRYFPVSLF